MSKKRKINQEDAPLGSKRIKTGSKTESTTSPIFSLPPEIIKEFLYYLLTPDCARFSFTSKRLRSIIWASMPRIELPSFKESHLKGLLNGCKIMTSLENLSIKITPSPGKTTDPTEFFASCKNMTRLEFDSGTFDPYIMISHMTSLKDVVIHWNKRPRRDIWNLDLAKLFPNHPHLTSFTITECSLSELQDLNVLSNLKCLTIEDCINMTSDDHIEQISTTLTALTALNLRYFESNADLSVIANLSQLVALDLSGSSFEEPLLFLTQLTNLKSLDLNNYEILSKSSVAAIAKMTQLTRLIIGSDEDQFQSDIKSLSVLTNLRELSIPAYMDISRFKFLERATFQYEPKLLSYVVQLPNLQDLSLIEVSLGKQIQHWVHLTRLQINHFTPNQVIPQLKYLQNLRELYLDEFYNDCQEALFKVLRPLTLLRTLGIQNLILHQAAGLDKLTQLQLVKVKSAPDLEFEGTHPNVAVEYTMNRHNPFMRNYNDYNDSLEGIDSDEDDEF